MSGGVDERWRSMHGILPAERGRRRREGREGRERRGRRDLPAVSSGAGDAEEATGGQREQKGRSARPRHISGTR